VYTGTYVVQVYRCIGILQGYRCTGVVQCYSDTCIDRVCRGTGVEQRSQWVEE